MIAELGIWYRRVGIKMGMVKGKGMRVVWEERVKGWGEG